MRLKEWFYNIVVYFMQKKISLSSNKDLLATRISLMSKPKTKFNLDMAHRIRAELRKREVIK